MRLYCGKRRARKGMAIMHIKKTIAVIICLLSALALLCGCQDKLSREEYASQLVEHYSTYEICADSIGSLATNKQIVAARTKLEEAEKTLNEIKELVPPSSYSDEHEKICEGCDNEMTRMNAALELIELSLKTDSLSDEDSNRITELQNIATESLEKSNQFYDLVNTIAEKELEKESKNS